MFNFLKKVHIFEIIKFNYLFNQIQTFKLIQGLLHFILNIPFTFLFLVTSAMFIQHILIFLYFL